MKVNSIVRNLNGDLDYKHLTEFQLAFLLKYYEEFRINSDKALDKQVKYKSNVLFHLLRLIGCKPDPDDFPLNSRISNERTESEIETVFNFMGWNYKPMRDYTNGVISRADLTDYVSRFESESIRLTFKSI